MPVAVSSTHSGPFLCTLGGLHLGPHREIKPLLLLVYLLLEKRATRDEVCNLLWPTASNPKNNLRVALHKLQSWGIQLEHDAEGIAAVCDSDLALLSAAAASTYTGDFLADVPLSLVSVEFETWVFDQRERLAEAAQQRLLVEAEARRCTHDRGRLMELAWNMPGAPVPTAHTLVRFLQLCRAGSPLHLLLGQELAELSDGWCEVQAPPPVQALLAWWLDGGHLWVSGDTHTVQRHLEHLQRSLAQAEQRPMHRLQMQPDTTPASLLHSLQQHLTDHIAPAATVVISGSGTLSSNALFWDKVQAQWPLTRFLILGCAPSPGALTLHMESDAQTDRIQAVPAAVPVQADRAVSRRLPPLWVPARYPRHSHRFLWGPVYPRGPSPLQSGL